MSDDALRRALAELARSHEPEPANDDTPPSTDQRPTFRETIERATAALEDVETAARFVEDVGLDELERAVEHAERSVSGCADDGRRALTAFREFEDAAEGNRSSDAGTDATGDRRESLGVGANDSSAGSGEHSPPGDHFHPGRGTSLGGGDIAPSK